MKTSSLIFDEIESILQPVVSDRLPKRPYCTDDLSSGLQIRPLQSALQRKYLQINPPNLKSHLIFDLDYANSVFAFEDALLPPPNLIVINSKNGHSHVIYALKNPVLIEAETARLAPIRYASAIEMAYTTALRADPCYAGLITKNPLCHKILVPTVQRYELAELADYVDLSTVYRAANEPQGLGRNVAVFDHVRKRAYYEIRNYYENRNWFVPWQSWCYKACQQQNAGFERPLADREINYIARSIARWVWREFSPERLQQLRHEQAERSRQKGLKFRQNKMNVRQKTAISMRNRGMKVQDIADRIGVSKSTAKRYLSAK